MNRAMYNAKPEQVLKRANGKEEDVFESIPVNVRRIIFTLCILLLIMQI